MKDGSSFMKFLESVYSLYCRRGRPKLKLYQNYLILHHLKAIVKRISEWAHFLNLTREFWRYLNVSAPKSGIF